MVSAHMVSACTGVFVTMFWIAYFLSPRFCHKFVGYLEEEAVKTYTHCLEVRPWHGTLTCTSTGLHICTSGYTPAHVTVM